MQFAVLSLGLALTACGPGHAPGKGENADVYTQVETKRACTGKTAFVFRECAREVLKESSLTVAEVEALVSTCASIHVTPQTSADDLFEVGRMMVRSACL